MKKRSSQRERIDGEGIGKRDEGGLVKKDLDGRVEFYKGK